MQNYTIIKELGKGAYGTVYQATENKSQRIVAIKQIHMATEDKLNSKNLVEIQSFKKIKKHPNIVTLYEAFKDATGRLCFVFEYISDGSLFDIIKKSSSMGQRLMENEIRQLIFYFLQGISHMHQANFMHRDLKPENVLMQAPETAEDEQYATTLRFCPKPLILKVADLGCAKDARQKMNINSIYTGTRWYRSIEMLMKDTTYNMPNDIWAIGCIACEMVTGTPLFPGQSELSQIAMIFELLGPMFDGEWFEYSILCRKMNYVSSVPLNDTKYITGASHRRIVDVMQRKLPGISTEGVECISWMLELNPQKRWTAAQLLNHPWFKQESSKFSYNNSTPYSQTSNYKPTSVIDEHSCISKARDALIGGSNLDRSVSEFAHKQKQDKRCGSTGFYAGMNGDIGSVKNQIKKQKEEDDGLANIDFDVLE